MKNQCDQLIQELTDKYEELKALNEQMLSPASVTIEKFLNGSKCANDKEIRYLK